MSRSSYFFPYHLRRWSSGAATRFLVFLVWNCFANGRELGFLSPAILNSKAGLSATQVLYDRGRDTSFFGKYDRLWSTHVSYHGTSIRRTRLLIKADLPSDQSQGAVTQEQQIGTTTAASQSLFERYPTKTNQVCRW